MIDPYWHCLVVGHHRIVAWSSFRSTHLSAVTVNLGRIYVIRRILTHCTCVQELIHLGTVYMNIVTIRVAKESKNLCTWSFRLS